MKKKIMMLLITIILTSIHFKAIPVSAIETTAQESVPEQEEVIGQEENVEISENVDDNSANEVVLIPRSLSDRINIGLLVAACLGLVFTGMQLNQTKKINRANLVKDLYLKLYDDKELRDIFYKIEWSEYSSSDRLKLEGSEEEHKADKLLSFFDVICNMYYRGALTDKDMDVFSYEMLRVYKHLAVQDYLSFLSEWQIEQGMGESCVNYKKFCDSRISTSKAAVTGAND